MGWICVLGWQTGAAAGAFLTGTMIQGLLVLNYPTYVYESWHGTLLMIAMGLFSVFFNTVLARKLPMIEGLVLMVHIGAFFGIIVTLWVLAPRADVSLFLYSQKTTFLEPRATKRFEALSKHNDIGIIGLKPTTQPDILEGALLTKDIAFLRFHAVQ